MIQKVEHKVHCASINPLEKGYQYKSGGGNDIDLFKIQFTDYQTLITDFLNVLNPTEISRANRYYHEKDKNRFVICRTLLKFLLAREKEMNIVEIEFDYGDNKKPFLPTDPNMFFNISHSGDYGIIGILRDFKIGVDVEKVNREFDFHEILPTAFNSIEIEHLKKMNDKARYFYTIWTRKEALVKAMGKGIDNYFPKIVVTDGVHHIDMPLSDDNENWQIVSFDLAVDHIASFAINTTSINTSHVQLKELPKTIEGLLNFSKD